MRYYAGRASRKVRMAVAQRWLTAVYAATGRTGSSAWRIQAALKPASRILLNRSLGVRFPFWGGDPREAARLAAQKFPAHAESLIKEADAYLEGRYRIFGCEANLKEKSRNNFYLPWHFDWTRGHYWDFRKPYQNENWENSEGIDPKRPWELSRMHHLVTLAQAYVLTRNPQYLNEISSQILAWHRENPYGLGVNWAVPMEAGIRLVNVLTSLALVGEDLTLSHPDFKDLSRVLPRFVFDHALFILKNSEWPNNHLIADLSCVLLACEMYPHFVAAESWFQAARAELERQLDFQVYPDGMDFEGSTAYHCLALELFFAPWLAWKRSGKPIPAVYEAKLRKMFAAVKTFMKPSGRITAVGDNDSGRLLRFSSRAALDRADISCLGSVLFEDSSVQACPEIIWWLGPEAFIKHFEGRDVKTQIISPSVSILKDGGLASFCDRGREHFICISLGRNGQNGAGGHAHNDRLSFELACYGEDIFVDPGTGFYSGDASLRNRLRSTGAHNTVSVEGEEQNRFRGLFALSEDVKNPEIQQCAYDAKKGSFEFRGRHDGYARPPYGVLHQRRIQWFMLKGVELVITDALEAAPGGGQNDLCGISWNFTLSPAVSVESCGGGKAVLRTALGRKYQLEASVPFEQGEALYSPEYGIVIPAVALTAKASSKLPESFTFRFTEIA